MITAMNKDDKIAPEAAEAEFVRFAESMDLDVDTGYMDDEDKTQFEKLQRRIVRAICDGSLVVNEKGEAVYTPENESSKHKDAITFHERTGASLMAMDGKKKGHDVSKTYAVMASMCKVPAATFANLAGKDIKVCEALFALLMD